MKTDRRSFLTSLTASALGARGIAQMVSAHPVVLNVPMVATGPYIRPDFIGLSYEVQQLRDPSFFSAENRELIRRFREISPIGVLRLGGNTSEFSWWKQDPSSLEPKHPPVRESPGEPQAHFYPITPESIQNLKGFLDATRWTCIFGIPLGLNTPEQAAAEAKFVAQTLGDRLLAFQVGNEVDLYVRHLRDPKTWSAERYLEEWLPVARAIVAEVPQAAFGLPDVSSDVEWLKEIAARWNTISSPPKVKFLSHHYYFSGPATNPDVNIPKLLDNETMCTVREMAASADASAQQMGIAVRMTEGNTCYSGGKPGVSDAFAAALWAADYALTLAKKHYAGVNLHGGNGSSVADSVGGTLPGDTMLHDAGKSQREIATHPHPFYTPIAQFEKEFVIQPVGVGLQFVAAGCDGHLLEEDWSSQLRLARVNASAYGVALGAGRKVIFLINKDLNTDVEVALDFGSRTARSIKVETLYAPSLESRVAEISGGLTSIRRVERFNVKVQRSSAVRVFVTEI